MNLKGCDRDFAQIEKRKKVCKCMVPKDLVEMIANARQIQPFVVTMMEKEDFYDFKRACDTYLNTQKVNISKIQWTRIEKENPGKIRVRETLNEMEEWKVVNVLKKGITLDGLKKLIFHTFLQSPEYLRKRSKIYVK